MGLSLKGPALYLNALDLAVVKVDGGLAVLYVENLGLEEYLKSVSMREKGFEKRQVTRGDHHLDWSLTARVVSAILQRHHHLVYRPA